MVFGISDISLQDLQERVWLSFSLNLVMLKNSSLWLFPWIIIKTSLLW